MDDRKENQFSQPPRSISQYLKITLLVLIIILGVLNLHRIKLAHYFPIKHVQVYGANHISHQEIETLIVPLIKKGFFNTHVDHVKERLLQLPWVENVFVRRNWPDQVKVTIIEKNAIAHWNDQRLLSDNGELFSPQSETYPHNLAYFVGPEGRQMMMLQYFNSMNRLFTPLNVKISYLELTPYLTWKLKLTNGISLQVGHKDILTRLQHFVKVYPKIVGDRSADVDYIDLRYPNGVAVRWTKNTSAITSSSKV